MHLLMECLLPGTSAYMLLVEQQDGHLACNN